MLPSQRTIVKSMQMALGTSACIIMLTSPAKAEDTHPCIKRPQPPCLMEMIEASVEDVGPFDQIDSEYLLISRLYLSQNNPLMAMINAQKIDDPFYRAQQLNEIAALYAASGESQRALNLYNEIAASLADVKGGSCNAITTLQYDALIAEALMNGEAAAPNRTADDPLIRNAVLYALSGYFSDNQELEKAHRALSAITHAELRDLAVLHYADAALKTQSVQKVAEIVDKVRDPNLKAEFYHTRLPLSLAKHGDMVQAIKWSHKIDDLALKTASFQRLAKHYYDVGNHQKAVQVLTFSKDFAHDIPDAYARSAALKTVGKLFYKMEHLMPARKAFAEALDAALNIDYLPRRLSALISVLEIQKDLGDQKGLRNSAFTAIRGSLLEAIDEYGKPGETNRFLTTLDGHISANDRVELLDHVLGLKSALLRGRILHKLSQIKYSEHITSTTQKDAFNKVMEKITHHTDVYESANMMVLMAGAAEAMKDPTRAEAIRKEVSTILAYPAHDPTRSAATMSKARDTAWRLMARELLIDSRIEEALDAYHHAKGKDPHPDLFLDRLIALNRVPEAMKLFPLELVAMRAAEANAFGPLMGRLKIRYSEDIEKLEAMLTSLLYALAEQQQWDATYNIVEALKAIDDEKWFWEKGNLENPSPALTRTLVMSYLSQNDYSEALTMVTGMDHAAERTSLLIHIAKLFSKKQKEEEASADSTIPPLPDGVKRERCST